MFSFYGGLRDIEMYLLPTGWTCCDIRRCIRANHDGTIDRMTNRNQQKQQQCKEEML